jgi:hypothetical protein
VVVEELFKDQNAVVLFLAFFVPGFISLQIYSLFVPVGDQDFTKEIPRLVAYSSIHYALTLWLILIAPEGWSRTAATYAVVLIIPCLWPLLILKVRQKAKWHWAQQMLKPEPSPWDRVFADLKNRWIKIKTKDGEFIGGYMGKGSLTSSYPYKQQIYISQQHKIDQESGKFQPAPVERTDGIIVDCEDIAYIQLYKHETG